MNRPRTTPLLALGLGLALQAAPTAAWWQWYSQEIPYGPVPAFWLYQNFPNLASVAPGQPWNYQTMPFGPMTMWTSTMPMSGLYVEQEQTPAGYLIRVRTGESGAPAVDIRAQGGFLTVSRQSAVAGSGGPGMQMHQSGFATQSLALPADANVAAMQMQRGDGLVEIFIPRGL